MSNTFRCDNHVPEHLLSAVTSSQTLTGDEVQLFGAMGVSIMARCFNGAAGTLYIDGTNEAGKNANYIQLASQALTANQTANLFYSMTDAVTAMHKMRCRFVSSAAGNIQVGVNARRMTY